MGDKKTKAIEYADFMHKNVEKMYGKKCMKTD